LIIGKIKLFWLILFTVLIVSSVLFASGCTQSAPNETAGNDNVSRNVTNVSGERSNKNIVQTLSDENNVLMVKLINASGLEDTLARDGPFTVFAPTNKAFEALPASTVQALMNNKTELRRILNYHITDGELMEEDLANMTIFQTLQGKALSVNKTTEGLQVGSAHIIKANIRCSNGVIHQIDKVLIPPK
jgi:uncharacterized surface protein with fasciclin (FAS1) repeats